MGSDVNELRARIVANKAVARHTYLMDLELATDLFRAVPGQFVMLRAFQGTDPLLRRAFSICSIKGDNVLRILYRVVGKATRLMAAMKRGDGLDLLGPLGNGFTLNDPASTAILVAGGIGLAPLIFLASRAKQANLLLLAGYRTGDEVVDLASLGLDEVGQMVATEDGTVGYHGQVTGLLEIELAKKISLNPIVYACGPWEMLKRTAAICREKGVRCEVSLESAMACGMGACQGCAVRGSAGKDDVYYHVCTHGPVFHASEIAWEV